MDIKQAFTEIRTNDSEQAFRFIYDTFYDRLFRTAFYYVHSDEDARDVALDVLATIWDKRKSMVFPDKFDSFLFIMARNASLNHIKASKSSSNTDNIPDDIPANSLSPHELLENDELFMLYENAVASLPPRCREVFLLVKEEGLSYAEVADQLGISVKTVDAQVQKATSLLRSVFSKKITLPIGILLLIIVFITRIINY